MSTAADQTRVNSFHGGDLAACFFLLVLAAALRLPGLDQGLWFDEIVASTQFFHQPFSVLVTRMPHPNHHPLYSILAKLSIMAFGESEWAMRLPAFIFGVLSPPLIYLFGARFLNRRIGLLAGLLFSGSMWAVWWSQDARGYSAMIFFTLLATYMYLALFERPGLMIAAAYALALAAAVYSHLFAGAVAASHLFCALDFGLIKKSGPRPVWPIGAALVGLILSAGLYLPFAAEFLSYLRKAGTEISGSVITFRFIEDLFLSWSAGIGRFGLSLPLLALAVAGLIQLRRESPRLLAVWTAALVIGLAGPWLFHTFAYHRFFCYALPGYYLLVAAGVERLFSFRNERFPELWFGVGAAMIVLMSFSLFDYYRLGKQPYQRAAADIHEQDPAAAVLSVGLSAEVYRYYAPEALPVPTSAFFSRAEWSRLKPMLRHSDHAVVVFSHAWSTGELPALLARACGPGRVFKSAGYREYDVHVFTCARASLDQTITAHSGL